MGYLRAERGEFHRNFHTAYIVVGVLKEYQGKGIGTTFFENLEKWAKARQKCFLPSDIPVQQDVRAILSTHRGLIEGGKKKNSADPFVIALAKQQNCKVVTEEVPTHNMNSPKIPDVCAAYNIECIDFIAFAREEKFAF